MARTKALRASMYNLDLQQLAKIDGDMHAKIFAAEVAELAKDCFNRAGDKSKRILTMELAMSPRINADGTIDCIVTTIDWKPKKPTVKSNPYLMKSAIDVQGHGHNGLLFNADLLREPDENTIMDVTGDSQRIRDDEDKDD